ncbi:MAG: hypothetical protein ACR2QC_04300, partial [Gammaproteobacteria bacterium]
MRYSRKEIPAFAGMVIFYIFGYRQIRYYPQRQKAPPFRRKPESHSRAAGISRHRRTTRPIPAKAGISAAAKRRVIV